MDWFRKLNEIICKNKNNNFISIINWLGINNEIIRNAPCCFSYRYSQFVEPWARTWINVFIITCQMGEYIISFNVFRLFLNATEFCLIKKQMENFWYDISAFDLNKKRKSICPLCLNPKRADDVMDNWIYIYIYISTMAIYMCIYMDNWSCTISPGLGYYSVPTLLYVWCFLFPSI